MNKKKVEQLLYYKKQGQGIPFIFLHGLFGMSDNWQSFAKEYQGEHTVYLVDQRNHGRSFHSADMNYPLMAEDLLHLFEKESISKAILLGHSMGGKTVMQFTQAYPTYVKSAIIVDMAPKTYRPSHEEIFQALESLNVDQIKSRTEAQNHLNQYFQDQGVQLFLLKNLKRLKKGGFEWKMNLKAIADNYNTILENPLLPQSVDVPMLFARGTKSRYIKTDDLSKIEAYFPNASVVDVEAGHWIHAEAPMELQNVIKEFLNS